MSDNLDESQAPGEAGTPASSTRLQRRRVLLSALGKGGVVLAATVPLAAKAIPAPNGTILVTNPGGANNRLCTMSGVGSLVASNVPNAAACNARSVAYYTNNPWPSGTGYFKVDDGGNAATLANTLLATTAFASNRTALDVLTSGSVIEQVFVAAALSSVDLAVTNFPYDLGQVQVHFGNRSLPEVDKFYRVLFGLAAP